MEALFESLVAFLKTHPDWILPVIYLIAFSECMAFLSFLVPATIFFTAFGIFAGAAKLDLFPIAVAAALGAGSGFWLSYVIGIALGPNAANHWPFRKYPELLGRGHAFFEKYGVPGIFFGHFVGPVRAVVAIVAGIVRMPQIPFQIANWSASFLWAFGLLYAGGQAGELVKTWSSKWPF